MAEKKTEKKVTKRDLSLAEAKAVVAANAPKKKSRKPTPLIENPTKKLIGTIGKAQRKPGLKGVAANAAVAAGGIILVGGTADTIAGRPRPVEGTLNKVIKAKVPFVSRIASGLKRGVRGTREIFEEFRKE